MPNQNETKPLLLKPTKVAETLGVSRTTIWRLTQSGELAEPVKVRGATRFRRSDVEAYVASLSSVDQEGTSNA